MKRANYLFIAILILISNACTTSQDGPADKAGELLLWYDEPAVEWTEALPLGNGTLGGMVFGGVARERVQLNESTVWTGRPETYAHPGAVEYLDDIRGLLQQMRVFERQGEWQKARELQKEAEVLAMDKFMSIPLTLTEYQPMADLFLDFPGHTQTENYRRELDLSTGLSRVEYETQGVRHVRESFASYPDQCIVSRISADQPGSVSFNLSLDSPHSGYEIKEVTPGGMVLRGKVENGVIEFEVHLQLITKGGEITQREDALEVSGANSATLKIVAASNYTDYKTVDRNPERICREKLEKSAGKSYKKLLQTHIEDYQQLFNRASLHLYSPAPSTLPTDERIRQFVSENDNSIITLIFNYGRYLAISGSREGGQTLNLQGIWNDKMNPPWGSKYTCNINIQMNHWPMDLTGISECNAPFFRTIKELAEAGQLTAREHYGAEGWVLHHNWDLWRATAPVNRSNHGIWVGGSGWVTLHLWEHFLYTGDLAFLEEYYPVMEGAVQFYTDFLYEDEITGYLISGPSNSPENGGLVMGPTMDHQIIRSLFEAYVLASRLLDETSELSEKAAEMAGRIAPNMIGQHDQLQEWLEDKDDPDNKHRHVSHLWGVHPGSDITWKDEALFNAAKQSLVYRGDEATGWSMAWKTNLWARFLDGDHAFKILQNLVTPAVDKPVKKNDPPARAGLYPNLFDAHPPFQIDGNFGACAGIAEMLIQSHILSEVKENGPLAYSDFEFLIHLLPALPSAWGTGSFEGLWARGGFEVSISWDNGELQTCAITSHQGNPCKLKYGDKTIDLSLEKGETRTISL